MFFFFTFLFLSNRILIRWVEGFKNTALLSSQFIFLEEHVSVIFAFSGMKEHGDQIWVIGGINLVLLPVLSYFAL